MEKRLALRWSNGPSTQALKPFRLGWGMQVSRNTRDIYLESGTPSVLNCPICAPMIAPVVIPEGGHWLRPGLRILCVDQAPPCGDNAEAGKVIGRDQRRTHGCVPFHDHVEGDVFRDQPGKGSALGLIELHRAMREGKWKLVAKYPAGRWELYDTEADRTEMHDLATSDPTRLKNMTEKWEAWAKRTNALPWPWKPAYGTVSENAKPALPEWTGKPGK